MPDPPTDLGDLQVRAEDPLDTVLDTVTQPIWVVDPSDVIRGALLHSLAGNHPLVDGNKRLAWLDTYVFLAKNGRPGDRAHERASAHRSLSH